MTSFTVKIMKQIWKANSRIIFKTNIRKEFSLLPGALAWFQLALAWLPASDKGLWPFVTLLQVEPANMSRRRNPFSWEEVGTNVLILESFRICFLISFEGEGKKNLGREKDWKWKARKTTKKWNVFLKRFFKSGTLKKN